MAYKWQSQKYKSWKETARSEAIPSNARPMTNGTWIINQPDGVIESDGNAFLARPIKHWRKQLISDSIRGGTASKLRTEEFQPGGTVYLGGDVGEQNKCCINQGYRSVSSINIFKNNKVCDNVYTVTQDDVENGWNGPIGKRICFNPETRVYKPGTTLLNKKYYTDSRAYLKSRCKLYSQRLSTTPIPGNQYYDENGKVLYPTDSPTGAQAFYANGCDSKCNYNPPTIIYKPNNKNFGVQGAVSSSSRLVKLKYDTVNKNGESFNSAFGLAAANAGKYLIGGNTPYFIKSKMSAPVMYRRNGKKNVCDNTPIQPTI
jgi:hypothetical protein